MFTATDRLANALDPPAAPHGFPFVALVIAGAGLSFPCGHAQIPEIAESHLAANVPEPRDFRPFLLRDLAAYFETQPGSGLSVDYELLRDIPTQSGVAHPKFHLWVTLSRAGTVVRDGAVRVAAVEKKGFEITRFVSRQEIVAEPGALAATFPAALLPKIRAKAGPIP